jgi:hypothetical protein
MRQLGYLDASSALVGYPRNSGTEELNSGFSWFPFLVAARSAGAAVGWFGYALNTAATFDVFLRLQITNDGLSYFLFESAPGGSKHIEAGLLLIHAQTVLSICFVLATSPGDSKPKS